MREFVIDGQKMTTPDQLYAHLGEMIWFPKYFGNNLDALFDVLSDVSEYTIIHFKNVDAFLDEMETYGLKVIRVFKMLEHQTDNYTVHFYPGEMNHE